MTLVVLPSPRNIGEQRQTQHNCTQAVTSEMADQQAELAFHVSWNGITHNHQPAATTP